MDFGGSLRTKKNLSDLKTTSSVNRRSSTRLNKKSTFYRQKMQTMAPNEERKEEEAN